MVNPASHLRRISSLNSASLRRSPSRSKPYIAAHDLPAIDRSLPLGQSAICKEGGTFSKFLEGIPLMFSSRYTKGAIGSLAGNQRRTVRR